MGVDAAAEALVDDLLRSSQRAMVVRAFCELGIADHLDAARNVDDLSQVVGAPPGSLHRLLRAVVPLGLCEMDDVGRYSLTRAGQMFRSSDSGRVAGWASLLTAPWIQRAWEQLGPAVREGRSYFPDIHGVGFWEYVASHPDEAGLFDASMTASAAGRADDLDAALEGTETTRVVDVGGGQGELLTNLLHKHPNLTGTVFERPEVVAGHIDVPSDVGDRLSWVTGDFRVDIPAGADVYLLSRILHDWPDTESAAIVRTCSAAMRPGARLCILEQITPDHRDETLIDQLDFALKDLNMLVLVGGQERSLPEYEVILRGAGLAIERVHAGNTCDVIVAQKPF